ncbi:MAG: CopG family transcriptional regulator [Eubacterium sp.]|nr:CopG family transcriptional regulator [Eubacterium sp.]
MAKVGRPKADNPKSIAIGVRLTVEDYEKLKNDVASHDITISEAVLQGLELLRQSWDDQQR